MKAMTPNTWFASLDFLQKWYSSFPSGVLTVDGLATQHCQPKKFWRPVESDYVHYTLAVRLLDEGGTGFADLCRLWSQTNGQTESAGLGFHEHFRRLAQLLQEFPRPEFDHFHNWLSDYLAGHWIGGYPTRLQSYVAESEQRITLGEAGAMLSSQTHQVALLIKNGVLRGSLMPLTPEGKLHGLAEKNSVLDLAAKLKESILCEEASLRLGLLPETVFELCRLRALPTVSGPTADGAQMIRVHPDELTKFVRSLQQRSVSSTDGMRSLWALNAVDAGVALSDALLGRRSIHIVLHGLRMETCLIGPKTPADESPLTAVVEDGTPVTNFCAENGISPSVLRLLVDKGLLEVQDGCVVNTTQFLAEYTWEIDAAQAIGMTLAAVRRWVKASRLEPVLQMGATYLFRKSQVLKFDLFNRCSVRDAIKILGLKHTQDLHRQYVQRGRLVPIGGPGLDGCRDYLFDRPEVLRLARGGLPELLTVREAARVIQVNYFTLLRWIREQRIPVQMGKEGYIRSQYLIERSTVEDLIGGKAQFPDLLKPTVPPCWREYQGELEQLLTTSEAAAMLGVSVETFQIRFRRTNRLLPCARQDRGGQHLFRRSHVEAVRMPSEA